MAGLKRNFINVLFRQSVSSVAFFLAKWTIVVIQLIRHNGHLDETAGTHLHAWYHYYKVKKYTPGNIATHLTQAKTDYRLPGLAKRIG